MNDKVTLQAISDIFSHQYGISKKTTDAFGKSFFDTIVEGLNKDGMVKIAGLGTFKIVEVGSRESVNVTNGERIVIDGYRKVSFVPDEIIEQKHAELTKKVEAEVADAAEEVIKADENARQNLIETENNSSVEQPTQEDAVEKKSEDDDVAERNIEEEAAAEVASIVQSCEKTENVEVPSDEFSGIDLLISTPESVHEVEKDLMLARIRAEQTLEEAKIANIEYRRLEVLLERLRNNLAPESLAKQIAASNVAVETSTNVAAEVKPSVAPISEPLIEPSEPENGDDAKEEVITSDAEPSVEEPALQSYLANRPTFVEEEQEDDEEEEEESSHVKLWIIIPLVGALLAAIAIFGYRYLKYGVPDDISFVTNVHNSPSVLPADSDSIVSQAKNEIKPDTATQKTNKSKDASAAEKEDKSAEVKKVENTDAKKQNGTDAQKTNAADVKKPAAPKTYVIQKGESLTRISQKMYGTKDSVNAIIKLNKFPDPNNVPIGTVIKLP